MRIGTDMCVAICDLKTSLYRSRDAVYLMVDLLFVQFILVQPVFIQPVSVQSIRPT